MSDPHSPGVSQCAFVWFIISDSCQAPLSTYIRTWLWSTVAEITNFRTCTRFDIQHCVRAINRVSLDMMSVQANSGPPWSEKNTTAFWRGRDSRQERLELVKLSRAHPNMIDAAFTNFFFFKHDESLYGPLVKHVSFFDFFKVRATFIASVWWVVLDEKIFNVFYTHL